MDQVSGRRPCRNTTQNRDVGVGVLDRVCSPRITLYVEDYHGSLGPFLTSGTHEPQPLRSKRGDTLNSLKSRDTPQQKTMKQHNERIVPRLCM